MDSMTQFWKNAAAVALFAALISGAAAQAQSREELEKWARRLVEIRNNECKDEDKRKVRGKIEYAAVLLAHSEVEEAEVSITKAAGAASGSSCREALTANASLGGGG